MDFSPSGAQSRNVTGITVAVAAHLVIGYALVNGLAHKVVEVLKKPLDVSLIEEIKQAPPPPPPKKALPPPKVALPPPAYVPPPQVVVNTPPPPAAIAAVSSTPAPPVEVAPQVKAPPAVAVGIACPNHVDVRSRVAYPPQAQRMGLSGDVVVEFTVGPSGAIGGIHIVRSTNPMFNDAAANAVGHLRCVGQGQDVKVRVPFSFRLEQ